MQNTSENTATCKPKTDYRSTGNAVYGLGVIGTFIYYVIHATSFWMGIVGFFKAILWPGFLVYYMLEFLNK